MLEIRSVKNNTSLVLQAEAEHFSEYFVAHLRSPTLEAKTRVCAYQPAGTGIAGLFRAMAREWRGWAGVHSYDSLEHELGLSCEHDGVGHITIRVRLSDSQNYEWSLKAELITEPGDLEHLALAAERFESALSTSA